MIARKSFLIVISYFVTRFLGWIGLVVLAKIWGDFAPEALGIIGFAISFLALFNIIADLGFSRAHVKRVSEGKDLGTCIGTYATVKLLLTGAMVTIVILTIFIWKNILHQSFTDSTTESIIFVFIIYHIFENLAQIAIVTFEARKEIAKKQLSEIALSVKMPFTILVAIAGASIAGIAPAVIWPEYLQPLQRFINEHVVGSLAMTYVFSIAAVFIVGIWFLRKYPIKKPDWVTFKSYYSYALPIMLFSVVGVISLNVDKLMIGYYFTSVEVGYYFTVQQILNIVAVFYISVDTVLFPTISEFHASNNFEKIKQTTHLAERYISMVMIPPIVIIIVFVYPVINIMLDSAFLPAATVLIILSIYTLIYSLSRPYGALIRGVNRPDITVKVSLFICASNIALNLLFIPKNGLLSSFGIYAHDGAAIATAISMLVGFFGFRLAAKKLTEVKLWQSHTPRHIIAGFVMGGTLYLLAYRTSIFPVIRFYHLIFFIGLGLGIYILVIYLLKEFTKEDLKFYLDIIHPRKMFQYVSSELKQKPPTK